MSGLWPLAERSSNACGQLASEILHGGRHPWHPEGSRKIRGHTGLPKLVCHIRPQATLLAHAPLQATQRFAPVQVRSCRNNSRSLLVVQGMGDREGLSEAAHLAVLILGPRSG